MSNGQLPKKADPRKLAEREAQITGSVDFSAMPRLVSFLCQETGAAQAELNFSTDEQYLRTVKGSVQAKVFMTCQRCLEPVALDLDEEICLAVVLNEEQARNLPGYYDPLLMLDEDADLIALVEDELILGLPSVPLHHDCSVQMSFGEAETVSPEQQKPNPFSVLAQLKNKADKS